MASAFLSIRPNFLLPWCFHCVIKFACFFGDGIVTFSFYFIFLIFYVCEERLFSLNNGIQSIALVFCYKKMLLDLFDFLLQICNNIVMNNEKYLEKIQNAIKNQIY